MDLGVVIGGDLRGLALPMVNHLAISGTAGECREALAAFDGVIDRVIPGGTWVGAPPGRIAQNHRAITETFAPTGR